MKLLLMSKKIVMPYLLYASYAQCYTESLSLVFY